jgi:Uma2 family endonuclease
VAEAAKQARMTVEEFVAWPGESGVRYELVDGAPVAMNPPMTFHRIIAVNIAGLLYTRLRGRQPCRAEAEVGVWIAEDDYYVAGLAVTCAPLSNTDRMIEPLLVVEILSKSTRTDDLGRKIPAYQEIASVREIWAVDSERRFVRVWRREEGDEGGWGMKRHMGAASFEGGVVGGAFALDDIYENTGL